MDYGLASQQLDDTSSTSSSVLSSTSGVYDADSPTLHTSIHNLTPSSPLHTNFPLLLHVRRGTGNHPLDQPSGEKARLIAARGSRSC